MRFFACALGLVAATTAGCVITSEDASRSHASTTADAGAGDGAAGQSPDPGAGGSTGSGPGSSPSVTYSGPLEVKDLLASMSAEQDETSLTVYAALLHDRFLADPDPDFVVLDSGDHFTASVGGVTLPMTEDNQGSKVRYVAHFSAAATGASVVVAFLRTNGKEGAPYSTVVLGAPFAISSAPASLRRGDLVSLAISSPSRQLTLAFEGPCVEDTPHMLSFDANGKATFDTSAINGVAGSSAGCDGAGHLVDATYGSVDSAFQRGPLDAVFAMEGHQQRSFPVHVAP